MEPFPTSSWIRALALSSTGVISAPLLSFGSVSLFSAVPVPLFVILVLALASSKRPVVRLACLLVLIVPSVALLEALLLAVPLEIWAKTPATLQIARKLYVADRKVIQWLPDVSRHDPELSYTLRPGHHHFSTREFSNEYLINSLGVRDDDSRCTCRRTGRGAERPRGARIGVLSAHC